ncbi:M20 family metallopeptidase [Shinella zoogloeoides]|uniref:M20 metallopeptidase family protein n=1 Tax=Shinella zoogloeoides TaxID=352475 RepID=UPI00299ECD78|nr:M20 family metallopeptidase [Shinella zoogloeoides]WPE23283.1 N-acetylcysteine deacetylase [Shinella zoogloeoides]
MSRPDPDTAAMEPSLERRMIDIRRHLHRNPELSNDERETQAYLKQALGAAGLENVRPVAGFGLAVDIVGTAGPSNRKVVIRADIDALPITEASGVPFASGRPGVMHACGHDAHAAMGYAAAVLLDRQRSSFSGTVRLIFQPAEEAEPLGGRRVIEEGLLDDVDAAIGIHVDPYTPAGQIAVGAGPYTLACDIFDVVVTGNSAHAAKPSDGVDAIAVACSMVTELQKIVSREIDPYDPLVVSVTGIEGGGAYNVIAPEVRLKGTIRSGHEETRQKAWRRLRQILEGIAATHDASVAVTIQRGEPPVVNAPEMVAIVQQAGAEVVGRDNVLNAPGWTAADDFAFYSEKCPSVYFRLGIRNEAMEAIYPLHHPKFRVDETALPKGAMTLSAAALRFLRQLE